MIKILDFTKRDYKSELNKLLLKRQIRTKINKNIVKKIINEDKKHRDKGLIKYEKKLNKNQKINEHKQCADLFFNFCTCFCRGTPGAIMCLSPTNVLASLSSIDVSTCFSMFVDQLLLFFEGAKPWF